VERTASDRVSNRRPSQNLEKRAATIRDVCNRKGDDRTCGNKPSVSARQSYIGRIVRFLWHADW
jgi:hypothetical protein